MKQTVDFLAECEALSASLTLWMGMICTSYAVQGMAY